MALSPGGAKAKGANAERELAAILTEYAREAGVALSLERNLTQTRGGGHDLNGLEEYGLAVEVKRVEVLDVRAWWRQACTQADRVGCSPLLAYRQSRRPWRYRVRLWAYPCPDPLDVDLEAEQFRVWFIHYLRSKQA